MVSTNADGRFDIEHLACPNWPNTKFCGHGLVGPVVLSTPVRVRVCVCVLHGEWYPAQDSLAPGLQASGAVLTLYIYVCVFVLLVVSGEEVQCHPHVS